MRQHYIPTQATRHLYRSVINSDLGVYRVQSGAGIGGFLRKMIKYVIPIGKSMLHKGFQMAKPELQKIANKGIESAANYGVKQINTLANKAQARVGNKRRRDALS